MSHAGDSTVASRNQRKRGVVRLVLGQLQVIGATIGLLLLLQTGVSEWTVGVIAATALVSLTSRLVFREAPLGENVQVDSLSRYENKSPVRLRSKHH